MPPGDCFPASLRASHAHFFSVSIYKVRLIPYPQEPWRGCQEPCLRMRVLGFIHPQSSCEGPDISFPKAWRATKDEIRCLLGNQLRCRDFCCFPEISRMSRVEGSGSCSACFFGIISAHQQWRRRLQGKGQKLCSGIYQAKFGYSMVHFIKWGLRPKEAPTELILLQVIWTPNICSY